MIGLVDILPLLIASAFGGVGARALIQYGLIGGCLGFAAGSIAGWYLSHFVLAFVRKRIPPRSIEELRELVLSEYSQSACSALLELSRRGEDVSDGIPVVRRLLLSDHPYERNIGSIILDAVYPDLAAQLGKFRPSDSSIESRKRVHALCWPDQQSDEKATDQR